MIPFRRVAFILSKSWFSAQAVPYTTRSNGAAFLNNLDFLAPAASLHPTKVNKLPWQQSQQNNTGISRGTSSITVGLDDLDDLNDEGLDSKALKATPKRIKLATGEAKDNDISKDNGSKGTLDRFRRDEEIKSPWIQYITSEGNQGQKRLAHVLKSFDRSQYYLIEVDSSVSPPVCKLFSKKILYQKAKEAKQAKKANAPTTKELQLNWGTDKHDLDHKLSKFRAFLEKGHRLEIQINGKRGRNTTAEERDAVMERVKAEFEPVSKYVRNIEWVKSTTVTMLLQGVPNKN